MLTCVIEVGDRDLVEVLGMFVFFTLRSITERESVCVRERERARACVCVCVLSVSSNLFRCHVLVMSLAIVGGGCCTSHAILEVSCQIMLM